MLLLLDECFDGPVRERIVVTFLRSKGTSDIPNIEDVVRLCRVTGYNRAEPLKRPRGYPEEYLARFQFPDNVLLMLVGRLRLDDLYNGIAHYPLPEHRRALRRTGSCQAFAAAGGALFAVSCLGQGGRASNRVHTGATAGRRRWRSRLSTCL